MVTLVLEDGSQEQCAIVDLSVSGVAVVSLHRPPLGSAVQVGKAPGRVVRHLESGFAVEFARVLSARRAQDDDLASLSGRSSASIAAQGRSALFLLRRRRSAGESAGWTLNRLRGEAPRLLVND